MVRVIRKRAVFFLGILLAGIAGMLGSYLRSSYSKDASPLIPTAKADLACWSCSGDGCDGCGDGCGGCSDSDSGY